MQKTPSWFAEWRSNLDFDTVEYGGIGVQLFQPDEVPRGQIGFAVASNGEPLVGAGPGDWRAEWVVVGLDTGCGDPIFASDEPPHRVFSAMHGEGSWQPKLVAPSIEVFAQCLGAFQRFANGRSSSIQLDANPPTPQQQTGFLTVIRNLTNGDRDSLGFWAVQIDVDLDAFNWLG